MKLKTILFFLFISGSLFKVNAQDAQIKFSQRTNDDRSVNFSYDKNDPGSYTIIIKFSELTNCSGPMEREFTLKGTAGSFMNLRPENKLLNIGFNYRSNYIRGKLNPKYDADFVYLLPYKTGTKVNAKESNYVMTQYFGKTAPADWKSYRFYTKDEDTVTAVRKGMVVELKDGYDPERPGEVQFTSKVNEITIEHPDGTLARYTGFKKGSFAVKLGQTVFPGTALGLNSQTNGNDNFNISFILMYLNSKDFENARNENHKSMYGFITPHFYSAGIDNAILVKGQDYTAGDTPDIIRKELNKRELKQFNK
ncbi:hypothetical protein HDF26_004465 [Pedobacter cryoconitis]|uniref:Peptidase M23-like protein n=1 Tax=Pedobacter cryoconitis TaxID=188932 RepID=A0A7W8ZNW8_9SPHI|nr:hypothetical protein [Pedobacter cryoconitis]MBB5637232.1 hypothetical protein [Pedobacter cryoconitis]MBB6273992.1 hypothetical protein [Pedobacter cryoconitis]